MQVRIAFGTGRHLASLKRNSYDLAEAFVSCARQLSDYRLLELLG